MTRGPYQPYALDDGGSGRLGIVTVETPGGAEVAPSVKPKRLNQILIVSAAVSRFHTSNSPTARRREMMETNAAAVKSGLTGMYL